MARLSDSRPVRQSEPLPVQMAGFFSNTYILGQHGWKLALDEDYRNPHSQNAVLYHQAMDLSLHGRVHGMKQMRLARAEHADIYRYIDPRSPSWESQSDVYMRARYDDTPHVDIQCAATRDRRVIRIPDLNRMSWRDTMPEVVEVDGPTELHRLPLFAQLLAPRPQTQELIVEPADVQSLLDQIMAAQGPMRREIRARDKRRDQPGQDAPRQVHAQNVSLHAA